MVHFPVMPQYVEVLIIVENLSPTILMKFLLIFHNFETLFQLHTIKIGYDTSYSHSISEKKLNCIICLNL